MSTPAQRAILVQCRQAAASAGHPFPGAAAAEAALETATNAGWFSSAGYTQGKNLLGIKATSLWNGPTMWLHGTEYIDVGLPAPSTMRNPVLLRTEGNMHVWGGDMAWCSFPDFLTCYQTQMKIFKQSHFAPQYAIALAAATPEAYILDESKVWATGPQRGVVVTQIYEANKEILS